MHIPLGARAGSPLTLTLPESHHWQYQCTFFAVQVTPPPVDRPLSFCSWLARFFYLKPREEHVDNYSFYIFRCNSTLANENTLYNVDCRYDEDLSEDAGPSLTRNEDATMPCFKVMGNDSLYGGVSQNSD